MLPSGDAEQPHSVSDSLRCSTEHQSSSARFQQQFPLSNKSEPRPPIWLDLDLEPNDPVTQEADRRPSGPDPGNNTRQQTKVISSQFQMLPAKTEEEAASTGTHPWMAHGRNAGSKEQQNREEKKEPVFRRRPSVSLYPATNHSSRSGRGDDRR